MKFTVKYSQKLDLENYLNRIWKNTWVDYGDKNKEYFYHFAPKEFIDALMSASDKASAEYVVKQYWRRTLSSSFEKDNEFLIKWFDKFLNEEKSGVIRWLEKAYGQSFPFEEITVYLTTCFFSPYNYEKLYFMVNRTNNFFGILSTARHELNHFMFYYYFQDYLKERGVPLENTEYLKEALAILTSGKKTENESRSPQLLRIEDFVKQNKDHPVKEIVDMVIKNDFFMNQQ